MWGLKVNTVSMRLAPDLGPENQNPVDGRSRAGPLSVRTTQQAVGNAGYSCAGACLTPEREGIGLAVALLTTAK